MTAYWFEGGVEDVEDAVEGLRNEAPEEAADLPSLAVESGVFTDEEHYYNRLHEATLEHARRRIEELEPEDSAVVHAVRTLDELDDAGGRLRQRVEDWRGDSEPVAEAEDVVDAVEDAREELRERVEREVRDVAPNLSKIAGPLLAARLIAEAGGLDSLAKMPSGTLQVLGAEDALFRHLQDGTPPPKHGLIYLHPYVHETTPEHRGSAARCLAGKLSIAARVDRYSGDLRPELKEELDMKIQEIQSRGEGG